MTLFVCDGEYILMDKITKETTDHSHLHQSFAYSRYDRSVRYHERISKLYGIEKPLGMKAWGDDILMWTMIGVQNEQIVHLLELAHLTDVESMLAVINTFPDKQLIGINTNVVFVTSNAYLNIEWDPSTQTYVCYESVFDTMVDYPTNGYFGYTKDTLKTFDFDLLEYKLTALEAMVLSQGITPELGDTFDSFHIPTRSVRYNIKLSDRQRKMIVDKIYARLKRNHRATPWDKIT